jgi:hypothetical protein
MFLRGPTASARARRLLGLAAALACGASAASPAHAAGAFNFGLVRSAALPTGCAPDATASVKLRTLGFAEQLTISVSGLAPNTKTDFFVIQVPGAPFGLSWYLGDLDADATGKVTRTFVSRLSLETFAVAPGVAPAPVTFKGDANQNPAFAPVQTYHLGIWFNSPKDAAKNGSTCPSTVTPFNGEHTAGVQVINSGNFKGLGPLAKIH